MRDDAADGRRRWVHDGQPACEARRDEVVKDFGADFSTLAVRAYDDDTLRLEEGFHRGGCRYLRALRGLQLEGRG